MIDTDDVHQTDALLQGPLQDRTAFTALFRALYPDLYGYARHLTRNTAAAEDLVQDTFLRLWQRRATLEPGRSVRALLFVTLRRLCLNHNRDAATRGTLLGQAPDPASASTPEETVGARQLDRHLRAWIQALPARRQEAFVLSRFYGLQHAEIAAVMGLAVHTAEKHITHALRDLRDHLLKFDPDLFSP